MRADAARSNIRLELARAGALGRGLRGRAAGRSLGFGPGKFLEPGRLEGPDAIRGGTDIESRGPRHGLDQLQSPLRAEQVDRGWKQGRS